MAALAAKLTRRGRADTAPAAGRHFRAFAASTCCNSSPTDGQKRRRPDSLLRPPPHSGPTKRLLEVRRRTGHLINSNECGGKRLKPTGAKAPSGLSRRN